MRLLCCVAFALLALGCAEVNAEVHAVVEEEMAPAVQAGPVGSEPSAEVVPEEEEAVVAEDAKPTKKKGTARTSHAWVKGDNPNQDPPWDQGAPWGAKTKTSTKSTKKAAPAKKAKKKAPAKKA